MTIKYHVRLSDEERAMLIGLIKQEKPIIAQHKKRKANILLAIDESHDPLQHDQVAKAFHVRPLTITRLRQRFVKEGLDVAVSGKLSSHGRTRKLDGEADSPYRPCLLTTTGRRQPVDAKLTDRPHD